jgi:hypothetical protein
MFYVDKFQASQGFDHKGLEGTEFVSKLYGDVNLSL